MNDLSNPEYLALLAEEMTQDELRVLLQRLGEQEFGDPKPTIGAVAEATSSDAITLSRMLRAIRNENLDQKIEKALDQRDAKIERLEKITDVIEDKLDNRLYPAKQEGAWFSDGWASDASESEHKGVMTEDTLNRKYRRDAERVGWRLLPILLIGLIICAVVSVLMQSNGP